MCIARALAIGGSNKDAKWFDGPSDFDENLWSQKQLKSWGCFAQSTLFELLSSTWNPCVLYIFFGGLNPSKKSFPTKTRDTMAYLGSR